MISGAPRFCIENQEGVCLSHTPFDRRDELADLVDARIAEAERVLNFALAV